MAPPVSTLMAIFGRNHVEKIRLVQALVIGRFDKLNELVEEQNTKMSDKSLAMKTGSHGCMSTSTDIHGN